jgi:hypothetical protein
MNGSSLRICGSMRSYAVYIVEPGRSRSRQSSAARPGILPPRRLAQRNHWRLAYVPVKCPIGSWSPPTESGASNHHRFPFLMRIQPANPANTNSARPGGPG